VLLLLLGGWFLCYKGEHDLNGWQHVNPFVAGSPWRLFIGID
jgi:hypothetical protein